MISLSTFSYADKIFSGFLSPESVVQDRYGNIFVSEIGVFGEDRDGKIKKITPDGQILDLASGLNDPKGIILYKNQLYVTDKDVIVKIDMSGNWEVFSGTMAFPKTPVFLNDIDVTTEGKFYITDSGNLKNGGMIFIMDSSGYLEVLMDETTHPSLKAPNGILPIDNDRFLVVDFATGELFEGDNKNLTLNKIIDGLGGGDGIVILNESIIVSDWKNGVLYKYENNQVKTLDYKFEAAADIALTYDKKSVIVPDMKAGTVSILNLNE